MPSRRVLPVFRALLQVEAMGTWQVEVAGGRESKHYLGTLGRPAISAVLGFPLKQIHLAFVDAGQVRAGRPTQLAVDAVEWLMNEQFEPGSFAWCCHWLSLDPHEVREHGLAQPKGGRVRGFAAPRGMEAIRQRWQIAATRHRRY
jgi:hypothetical protein